MKSSLRTWILISVLTTALPLFAGFPIVKDGKPAASVQTSGFPSKPLAFAGLQLRTYVKKITGATLPGSGGMPYKIRIGPVDSTLPAKAAELAKTIRDDGFLLYADEAAKTLYITAKEERGLNLGVYELLKTYGGIRWIFPGRDGEFFTKKKNIILPDNLAVVKNPALRDRRFNLVCAYGSSATWLWMLRNGMSADGDFYGGEKTFGGHIFSHLLPDTFFKEKPDLYCFAKGKRHPQCGNPEQIDGSPVGGQANQPCTSNPETVRIMCESMKKILKKEPGIRVFDINNNDSTQWCECENCKKLDPPDEARRGIVSTRYWLLVNELIKAGREAAPDVRFRIAAYQTFQEYPMGVKPHPEAEIILCPHHRCYLHSIGDKKCQINERYRGIMESWSKNGHKVSTYEYTDILPRGKVWYLPMPRLLAEDLKWYAMHKHNGWCDEVAPFDGTFVRRERVARERWVGNILDLYLTAALTWNPDLDIDAYEDEAGALYYGKAWNAMKQYRKKLFSAYKGICDHFRYGSPLSGLGKAFEAPGVEKELKSLLNQALKDASGDSRVESIVKRDMEFFALTFEEAASLFRKNAGGGDVCAARYSPEDPDWDLADWTYAGELPVKTAYLGKTLYVRIFPDGALPADSALEVTLNGKTQCFIPGKETVFELELPKEAVPGETVCVGIVYRKGSERFSWNGGPAKEPEFYRTVSFGMYPILKNGSFESLEKKETGNTGPTEFGMKGGQKPVRDDGAAAGRIFLRGGGFVFQYLNGLLGTRQTYGVPEIFTGKLEVRVKYRGKGRAGVRLTTSDLVCVGEQNQEIASSDWEDTIFEFDCSKTGGKLLILYVFSFSGELDMDDIRIYKK